MPPKFIAHQLSNPHGLAGYVIGRLMNYKTARVNAFAVQQLELRPSDRVLEIGFGGGLTLPALIAGAGFVAGLDRSPDVVKLANSRFCRTVEEDRAEFRVGLVESMPYDSGYFTKVCTVNTVDFWKSLTDAFEEIFRVLAPNGRVAVGFLPKQYMDRMGMPPDVFTSRNPEEIACALSNVGFRGIRSALPKDHTPWNVIVAER
jgi:ubiquinone/menaquinone biosynthesis C-methylase UbiE